MSLIGEKQSVYIVRYGKTKFDLIESVGPFDSKILDNNDFHLIESL